MLIMEYIGVDYEYIFIIIADHKYGSVQGGCSKWKSNWILLQFTLMVVVFLCSSENTDGQPNSQSKDMGQRLSLSFQFIIPATLR